MTYTTVKDDLLKCCRCRNKHRESEREESKPDKYGMRTLLCPRCGAGDYHRLDDDA